MWDPNVFQKLRDQLENWERIKREPRKEMVHSLIRAYVDQLVSFQCGKISEETFLSGFVKPWLTVARSCCVHLESDGRGLNTEASQLHRVMEEADGLLDRYRPVRKKKHISFTTPLATWVTPSSSMPGDTRTSSQGGDGTPPPPPLWEELNEVEDSPARNSGTFYGRDVKGARHVGNEKSILESFSPFGSSRRFWVVGILLLIICVLVFLLIQPYNRFMLV